MSSSSKFEGGVYNVLINNKKRVLRHLKQLKSIKTRCSVRETPVVTNWRMGKKFSVCEVQKIKEGKRA